MTLLILLLLAYLIGSIPFGVLMGMLLRVDLQASGSGNIGATNALRTMGKKAGAIVFILDFLKGMVPTLLALTYVGDPGLVALVGLLSVVGHIYPVWLGFRGGKGVATTAGVILPIAPDMFLIGLVFFIAIVFVTRYVSLASMSITVLVLLCMLLFQKPLPYSLLMLALSLLVIYRHSENIARLLNGTENKIGAKKK